MSTYLYLVCNDHTPPLHSDGEVGQHLTDLPRIRAEISKRDVFVAAAEHHPSYDYFTGNAARFFSQHPRCAIGIVDEYDKTHGLTDRGEE